MIDLEKLSVTGMELVTYGGCAKSMYLEALRVAKEGNFEEAYKKIEEADQMIGMAHGKHLEMLQEEALTKTPQVSLLILHAEDQVMSCETIKLMVLEFIELYKKGVK